MRAIAEKETILETPSALFFSEHEARMQVTKNEAGPKYPREPGDEGPYHPTMELGHCFIGGETCKGSLLNADTCEILYIWAIRDTYAILGTSKGSHYQRGNGGGNRYRYDQVCISFWQPMWKMN